VPGDYHIHGMGHGERGHTVDDIEPFILKAQKEGLDEIGFVEHDWFLGKINFETFKYLQTKYPQIAIRIGLEVDHIFGREEEIARFIWNKPFDYILGGIHHLGRDKWMFDHPDYIYRYNEKDIDDLYREYFATVKQAAQTQLYQVMPHLDLIKVFGFRPSKSLLTFTGEMFYVLKQRSLVVEINTSGLRKPVQEIYPCQELLKECFTHNIPITFGSDAHQPEDTGRDINLAYEYAKKTGYRKYVTFVKKRMIIRDLE
jgi:histidinol-phosphatase (PHP family)